MIPRIIHYIWFGNPLKKPAERINKWKEVLIGWDFKEWTEKELDVNDYLYTKAAYDLGLYGICIDPFRPKILLDHGGVWLDTDVNVHRDFSNLLDCSLLLGRHPMEGINVGVIGAKARHPLLQDLVDEYKDKWNFSPIAITAAMFAVQYSRFAPELMYMRALKKRYGISTPPPVRDLSTEDGVLRIRDALELSIVGKFNPELNYTEHLQERSWQR